MHIKNDIPMLFDLRKSWAAGAPGAIDPYHL
jgi:hypothetical protein